MKKIFWTLIISVLSIPFIFGQEYNSKLEIEVVEVINQARQDPKGFADKYLKDNSIDAAKECYKEMKSLDPLPDLQRSEILWKASKDHVDDIGALGLVQHEGTDGSHSWDRIERYGEWNGKVGENIQFGYDDALKIVLDLLIDDGVPSRGHRKNILSPDFNYIGVAIGDHKKYKIMTVMDFVGSIK